MGFLRRMAGILGFIHAEDGGDATEDDDREGATEEDKRRAASSASASAAGSANRKGFSVQVPVPVERSHVGPVLVPCDTGEGGVQGFKWYGRRLRVDEEGDVADEFLDELPSDSSSSTVHEQSKKLPTFRVKHAPQPAVVRSQMVAADGTVRHGVELRGRLEWI